MIVHNSFLHDNKKWETAQVFTNRWIAKPIMLYVQLVLIKGEKPNYSM